MGLLDWLFPTRRWKTAVVDSLASNYMERYGYAAPEAVRMARECCEVAIAACKADKTAQFPINFGDILVGDARASDDFACSAVRTLRPRLALLLHSGATTDDIRNYWNGVDGLQETPAHGETRNCSHQAPRAPSAWPA